MLTILGRPFGGAGFCDSTRLAGVDRLSRRGFLQIGGAAMGGLALNEILAMEARAGDRPLAQGDHQYLSARRAAPYRHVGPQAGCPGRNPRRVQADQDERAGHRNLRAVSQDGRDDGQVRHHPHAGRFRRPARRLSMHDRAQAGGTRPERRLAVGGSLGLAARWTGRSGRACQHGRHVSRRAIAPGASRARRTSWARSTIRSTWSAARPASGRTTWCSAGSRSSGFAIASSFARPSTTSAATPTPR